MPSTENNALPEGLPQQLIAVARRSIEHGLSTRSPLSVDVTAYPLGLREPRATFVTLMLHEALRGCIGTLEANRPLVEDVVVNAYAAAFHDPRFSPLTEAELLEVKVRISILSPNTEVQFCTEEELLRTLRPGVDGLTIQRGDQRATFLPVVWESLPRPEDFLEHLKHKAGIPAGSGSNGLRAWRYTTESFAEPC
jgi:AmmeMemoRadiSam system protein A